MSRRDPRRPLFELLGSSLRTWHHLSFEGEDEEGAEEDPAVSERLQDTDGERTAAAQRVPRPARRRLRVTWSADLCSDVPDPSHSPELGQYRSGPAVERRSSDVADSAITAAGAPETEFASTSDMGSDARSWSPPAGTGSTPTVRESHPVSGGESGSSAASLTDSGCGQRPLYYGDVAADSVGAPSGGRSLEDWGSCESPRPDGSWRPTPRPRARRSGSSSSTGSISRELYEETHLQHDNRVACRWRPTSAAGEYR